MTQPATLKDFTLGPSIGRGNTSEVYLASGPDGKTVALKVPLPATLEQREMAERFGNEVRLSLQFRHPGLLRAYAGTAFGPQAFLALEYYPDGPLSEQLQGTRLQRDTALGILADVAAALDYLHRLGAVHQDVKPQNVYVSGGRAVIGDLGCTYFQNQGSRASGSPFYMAPEVYHGEVTSSASDVYSLGVMAYELLTGERPFVGESYEELMVAHLTGFPTPIAALAPDLPRSLAKVLDRTFAKRPHERPAADEVQRELRAALGEEPSAAAEAQTSVESAPAPQGRHGAGGRHGAAAEPTPARQADTPQSRGWNPFKRRKG